MMFQSLSEYLTGLYQRAPLDKAVTSTQAASDTTASVPEDEVADGSASAIEGDTSSAEQGLATSSHQHVPRVELVSLLIDVAGITREKSQFTQYLNYCYTLTKESKPVHVEILPANAS